jgi:WD40 repeat protein
MGDIRALIWHPHEQIVAVGGSEGVWVYSDIGEAITHFEIGDADVSALAWHPDGNVLAVRTTEGEIQFWERVTDNYKLKSTIKILSNRIYALAYNPDGTQIASES